MFREWGISLAVSEKLCMIECDDRVCWKVVSSVITWAHSRRCVNGCVDKLCG